MGYIAPREIFARSGYIFHLCVCIYMCVCVCVCVTAIRFGVYDALARSKTIGEKFVSCIFERRQILSQIERKPSRRDRLITRWTKLIKKIY